MNNERIVKISSITKKLLVGLLGSFLLIFLLFHMSANLLILAHDGGDAYSAFCHFMGSNIIVKIVEIVLLAVFVLHIILATYLWFCNRGKRPVRYHVASKTKTAPGSKLMMITGSLLLVCLVFHFYDFYFVKHDIVKGTYMVKTEDLNNDELNGAIQSLQMYRTTPEEMVNMIEQARTEGQELSEEDQHTYDMLKAIIVLNNSAEQDKMSKDLKWIRQISVEERETLEKAFPEAEFEPDFYHMARQKFSVWHVVLCYLIFFALVGIHIRHGFESAFQTFGLNHYRYSKLIAILGVIYCWVVCVGFSVVPLGVFFGL